MFFIFKVKSKQRYTLKEFNVVVSDFGEEFINAINNAAKETKRCGEKEFRINFEYVPKAKLNPTPKSELDNIPRTIPAFGIWQFVPGIF
jgi:hypothetical protein